MLNLFKSKTVSRESKVYAPAKGEMIKLEEVKDQVFSQKMMGEGVAFVFNGNQVSAPCDGTLTMVFPTKHAFGITMDNGAEILVHIGMDTVNLKGEGFKQLVKENSKVKQGQPIIEIDRDIMKKNNVDLTTPVIVTNSKEYELNINGKYGSVELSAEVLEISNKGNW